jgi:hypothetical protein
VARPWNGANRLAARVAGFFLRGPGFTPPERLTLPEHGTLSAWAGGFKLPAVATWPPFGRNHTLRGVKMLKIRQFSSSRAESRQYYPLLH